MVTFYLLATTTKRANSEKFGLGQVDFIDWYKSESKVYAFSEKFNRVVIADNPKIGRIIGGKALEDNLLGSTDTTGFAYFYLSDYFARSICKEFETLDLNSLEKSEANSFRELLARILDKSGSCMVEYGKKEGWFDYDDTLKKRTSFEKQMEETLKKKGLLGN